jgi:hypothetical protein
MYRFHRNKISICYGENLTIQVCSFYAEKRGDRVITKIFFLENQGLIRIADPDPEFESGSRTQSQEQKNEGKNVFIFNFF